VVSELMKRTWAAQMKVLCEIDRICKKHSITWFAYYGTLLGAVRHGGFIPWDDDIDIAMKKEDYAKFLKVAKEELPAEYCMLNTQLESEYENPFTRITNETTINLGEKHMQEYYGCPFAVGVDIFPLYYLPREPEEAAVLDALLEVVRAASGYAHAGCKEQLSECLAVLEEVTGVPLLDVKNIENQLLLLFDRIGCMYGEEESDEMTIFGEYIRSGYRVRKEWLEECIEIPFENIPVMAPKEYDKVLEGLFPNYREPKREYDTHEYPFYQKQLDSMRDYIENRDMEWKKEQDMQLDSDWQSKIVDKKVVLFHTNADAMMCHADTAAPKIAEVLKGAEQRADIVLWWIPCLFKNPKLPFLKEMVPELIIQYEQILDAYCKDDFGICDMTSDVNRAITIADYYYGDEGWLAQAFRDAGKPVIIQSYES